VEKILNYVGPSMHPTLEVGDGLQVLPYHGRQIRCGDVVVFPHPSKQSLVVHRVVRVDGQGIRTRGDNSPADDPWVLAADRILGQVSNVRRRGRQVALAAGPQGRLAGAVSRFRNQVRRAVSVGLRPAYGYFSRRRLSGRWPALRCSVRIVQFNRPQGVERQLFLGRYRVGRLAPGATQWQIRPPFRLLIDVRSLPTNCD
jgi:signal peptidase I